MSRLAWDGTELEFKEDHDEDWLVEDDEDLEKHCGVCEEDDLYARAPIARGVTINFPNQNHANGVEIVAMAPLGLPAKPALWKPEGGEDVGLQSWIGGPQYVREEAAYLLDRALGFYLVPVAYVAEANDEYGAAIYYGFDAGPAKPPDEYDYEWIEKAGVLDYVMCQKDRGYKHNYHTHPDNPGRMILFDNGLSFPADGRGDCHSPFESLIHGKDLSGAVLVALAQCLEDAVTWIRIDILVGFTGSEAVRVRIMDLITSGWKTKLTKFEEDEHPRDSLGRFEGEGGAVAAVAEKPAIEPGNKKGPMNNVGGSYRRVRQNSKPGEEIHHMPADTASNLHPSNGPAIAMPKEDHFKTASYGTSSAAQQYRAEQRKLIIAGKFEEAQQMDIDDLRAKFGNKYDAHIKEMRNYTSTLKSRKGSNMLLNPTPKVIRAGGA